ncbi:hypothetical protein FOMA001_g7632 [Fusarium oxysporum f. sp. matthiolae]|nr:hypothetical protein FOMA001_g7632 [Fusarium oxysporum f. sp. matthiolae]
MSSFPFGDLPTETKKNVILNALPSVTAPHRYYLSNIARARIHEYVEEQTLKKIQDSDPVIASLSNQVRCLKAINPQDGTAIMSSVGGVEFRLDPKHDTFKAMEMRLPAVHPSASWNPQEVKGYHKYALPFENVLNVAYRTYLARGQAPPPDDGLTIAGPSTAPVVEVPPTYYNIPFEKDLPIFARLPKAKNLSLIVEYAGREWHINGFQMNGPDVVGRRYLLNRWGLIRSGDHSYVAEEYYRNRRIPADTGIAWNMPGRDRLSDPEDLEGVPVPISRYGIPNIGFNAYSRGNISLGGNWAGFRFWVDNNKIEFSPLCWQEVEPLIGEYYGLDERGYNTFSPGLVARVWVIRSEQDLEPTEKPHHHWIVVREPEFGDPEWVEQIAATWKMTRQMLSHVRGSPIEEDEERNVAADNYCFQMEP